MTFRYVYKNTCIHSSIDTWPVTRSCNLVEDTYTYLHTLAHPLLTPEQHRKQAVSHAHVTWMKHHACVCTFQHMYIHACIHTCIHQYAHTCLHTPTHIHIDAIHTYTLTHTYTHSGVQQPFELSTCTSIETYRHTHTHIHIDILTCITAVCIVSAIS
jgi:hypothetical protein